MDNISFEEGENISFDADCSFLSTSENEEGVVKSDNKNEVSHKFTASGDIPICIAEVKVNSGGKSSDFASEFENDKYPPPTEDEDLFQPGAEDGDLSLSFVNLTSDLSPLDLDKSICSTGSEDTKLLSKELTFDEQDQGVLGNNSLGLSIDFEESSQADLNNSISDYKLCERDQSFKPGVNAKMLSENQGTFKEDISAKIDDEDHLELDEYEFNQEDIENSNITLDDENEEISRGDFYDEIDTSEYFEPTVNTKMLNKKQGIFKENISAKIDEDHLELDECEFNREDIEDSNMTLDDEKDVNEEISQGDYYDKIDTNDSMEVDIKKSEKSEALETVDHKLKGSSGDDLNEPDTDRSNCMDIIMKEKLNDSVKFKSRNDKHNGSNKIKKPLCTENVVCSQLEKQDGMSSTKSNLENSSSMHLPSEENVRKRKDDDKGNKLKNDIADNNCKDFSDSDCDSSDAGSLCSLSPEVDGGSMDGQNYCDNNVENGRPIVEDSKVVNQMKNISMEGDIELSQDCDANVSENQVHQPQNFEARKYPNIISESCYDDSNLASPCDVRKSQISVRKLVVNGSSSNEINGTNSQLQSDEGIDEVTDDQDVLNDDHQNSDPAETLTAENSVLPNQNEHEILSDSSDNSSDEEKNDEETFEDMDTLISEFQNLIAERGSTQAKVEAHLSKLRERLENRKDGNQALQASVTNVLASREQILKQLTHAEVFDESCEERINCTEKSCDAMAEYLLQFKNLLEIEMNARQYWDESRTELQKEMTEDEKDIFVARKEAVEAMNLLKEKDDEEREKILSLKLKYADHLAECTYEISQLSLDMEGKRDDLSASLNENRELHDGILEYQRQISELTSAKETSVSETEKSLCEKIQLQNENEGNTKVLRLEEIALEKEVSETEIVMQQKREVEEEIRSIEDHISKAHENLQMLQNSHKDLSLTLHKLREGCTDLEDQLCEKKSVTSALETDNGNLQKELSLQRSALENLDMLHKMKILALEEEFKSLILESEKLQCGSEKARMEVSEKIQEYNDKLATAEKSLDCVKSSVKEKKTDIDVKEKYLNSQAETLTKLQSKLQVQNNEIEVNLKIIQTQEDTIMKLTNDVALTEAVLCKNAEAYELRVKSMETELSNVKIMGAESQVVLTNLTHELNKKNLLIQSFTKAQQQMEEDFKLLGQSKCTEIKELSGIVQELQYEYAAECVSAKNQITELCESFDERLKKYNDICDVHRSISMKIDALKEKKLQKQNDLSSLKDQLYAKQTTCQSLMKDATELEVQIVMKEESYNRIKKEFQELQCQNTYFKSKLEDAAKKKDILENEAAAKNNALQANFCSIQNEVMKMQEKVQEVRRTNADLQTAIERACANQIMINQNTKDQKNKLKSSEKALKDKIKKCKNDKKNIMQKHGAMDKKYKDKIKSLKESTRIAEENAAQNVAKSQARRSALKEDIDSLQAQIKEYDMLIELANKEHNYEIQKLEKEHRDIERKSHDTHLAEMKKLEDEHQKKVLNLQKELTKYSIPHKNNKDLKSKVNDNSFSQKDHTPVKKAKDCLATSGSSGDVSKRSRRTAVSPEVVALGSGNFRSPIMPKPKLRKRSHKLHTPQNNLTGDLIEAKDLSSAKKKSGVDFSGNRKFFASPREERHSSLERRQSLQSPASWFNTIDYQFPVED